MIVSHRHRFVFFAVPRTATHAIRAALASELGPDGWRQEALTERVALPVRALARIGHGHISVRQAAEHLPDDCQGYFKFAFVRHPFDRFVSACAMLNRRNDSYAGRERAFMRRALAVPRFRARILVQPQVSLLTDPTGEIDVDYIGRFETLQASFDSLCDRLGLTRRELSVRNATTSNAPVLGPEIESTLAEFYREDFRTFGYSPTARGVIAE